RSFAGSNLEALLRYGDTGAPALTSDLYRFCPRNFPDARVRGMITTHSLDLDRPGASPWIFRAARGPYEAAATMDPDDPAPPLGPGMLFPAGAERGAAPFDPRQRSGDFARVAWRALPASLGRVNLNRPLPPYPPQGRGQAPPFGPPLTVRSGQVALDMA